MGLAVLPARLKEEIALMKDAILTHTDFASVEAIAKHKVWFEAFKDSYHFTADNTEEILKSEIGKTFQRVLEDAGVYKRTEGGHIAFLRFIATIR
jgi:UDPglucose--hexose-1-phosphate uridylyltransferase